MASLQSGSSLWGRCILIDTNMGSLHSGSSLWFYCMLIVVKRLTLYYEEYAAQSMPRAEAICK